MNFVKRFVLPLIGAMGARLAGAGFGFLTQVILARGFSQHDVGIIMVAMSVMAIASLVITNGYPALALTQLARYYALERPALIHSYLWATRRDMLLTAAAVVGGAVLAALLGLIPNGIELGLLFGCVAALPHAAIRLNNSSANTQRRFQLSYGPDFVLRPLLLFLFILAIVALGLNVPVTFVLSGLVVTTAIVAALQAFLLGRDNVLTWDTAKPARDLRRHLRSRAWSMLVIAIATGATADLVVMIAGVFFPPSEIAVLGVAVRLAALVEFVSGVSQRFVLRDLTTAITQARPDEVQSLLLRTNLTSLSSLALAILGAAVLGPFMLRIFGPQYADGYGLLLLFVLAQAFRIGGGMNGHLLALNGYQTRSASVCLLSVLMLLLLSVILAPLFGTTGLALAVVGSEAFWAIGLTVLAKRLTGRRGDIFAVLGAR